MAFSTFSTPVSIGIVSEVGFSLPTLKKISGTKTVPLGHHLIVRKTVPFGALFWCHFPKGHYFVLVTQGHQNSALFVEKGTIFQNGAPRALF